MFVEITKKENNSPIGMDALFKKQRDNGGITPEFAMEVLQSTNHYGNIKQIARHILSLETPEERLAYKDFVVSAVDKRETTPDTFKMLYGLACEGGYDVEFFNAFIKPKEYDKDYCNFKTLNVVCKNRHDELPQDVREYDRVVFDYSEYTEQRAYPSIKFACKECYFKDVPIITVEQDSRSFIEAEKFKFSNIGGVEYTCDYSTNSVEFVDCTSVTCCIHGDRNSTNDKDLEVTARNLERLSLVEKYFKTDRFIKGNFDNVSRLSLYGLDLRYVDMSSIKGVKRIDFYDCTNFPENLDLSAFDEVYMTCRGYSDINQVKDIKFKDGAKVSITPEAQPDPDGYDPPTYYNIKIPACIDFSKCSEVILGGSLEQYDTLSFSEGTKVEFERVTKYPKVLDVSKCGEVTINRYIDNVNEIIVRDMAQLEDIAKKSRTVEKEQKQVLSQLKKKATFVNKEKSSGFLSKIWERGE